MTSDYKLNTNKYVAVCEVLTSMTIISVS